MKAVALKDILGSIQEDYEVAGNPDERYISNFPPPESAGKESLIWIHPGREDAEAVVSQTGASVIICSHSVSREVIEQSGKCAIRVNNPKLTFSRIVNRVLREGISGRIHETAIIHPEAVISSTASIGPNTYVGKCEIGDHTEIHGNSYLYDNTRLGSGVVVEAGVVIGAEGFGLAEAEDGSWEKFPHLGGVLIGDRVLIGANSTIDRGGLGDTSIGDGTKISKSVHISHNVAIGSHCIVTGKVVVAGSTVIGNHVWISPGAVILNKLKVGNHVFISAGSVVSQNIDDNFQAIGRKIMPRNFFNR